MEVLHLLQCPAGEESDEGRTPSAAGTRTPGESEQIHVATCSQEIAVPASYAKILRSNRPLYLHLMTKFEASPGVSQVSFDFRNSLLHVSGSQDAVDSVAVQISRLSANYFGRSVSPYRPALWMTCCKISSEPDHVTHAAAADTMYLQVCSSEALKIHNHQYASDYAPLGTSPRILRVRSLTFSGSVPASPTVNCGTSRCKYMPSAVGPGQSSSAGAPKDVRSSISSYVPPHLRSSQVSQRSKRKENIRLCSEKQSAQVFGLWDADNYRSMVEQLLVKLHSECDTTVWRGDVRVRLGKQLYIDNLGKLDDIGMVVQLVDLPDMATSKQLTPIYSVFVPEEKIAMLRHYMTASGYDYVDKKSKTRVQLVDYETNQKFQATLQGARTASTKIEESPQYKEVERILHSTNYFDVLNVPSNAESQEIEQAYRAMQVRMKRGDNPDSAMAIKVVNQAYICLMDPIAKALHSNSTSGEHLLCETAPINRDKRARVSSLRLGQRRHGLVAFLQGHDAVDFRLGIATKVREKFSTTDETLLNWIEGAFNIEQVQNRGVVFPNITRFGVSAVSETSAEIYNNKNDFSVVLKKSTWRVTASQTIERWEAYIKNLSLRHFWKKPNPFNDIDRTNLMSHIVSLVDLGGQTGRGSE